MAADRSDQAARSGALCSSTSKSQAQEPRPRPTPNTAKRRQQLQEQKIGKRKIPQPEKEKFANIRTNSRHNAGDDLQSLNTQSGADRPAIGCGSGERHLSPWGWAPVLARAGPGLDPQRLARPAANGAVQAFGSTRPSTGPPHRWAPPLAARAALAGR